MVNDVIHLFYREVNGIEVKIYFDEAIFLKNSQNLKKAFGFFNYKKQLFYECSQGLFFTIIKGINRDDFKIIVIDPDDAQSFFSILLLSEEYFINQIKLPVFHGAMLYLDNVLLLLLGSRQSGKTTMASFLQLYDWNVVDDDCIFFLPDNTFTGLGFPIRSRNQLFLANRLDTVTSCDSEGCTRYLTFIDGKYNRKDFKKKIVIFPHYSFNRTALKTKKIPTNLFFSLMIQNTRYSISKEHLFKSIINFSKSIDCAYDISYQKCEDVLNFLNYIIRDNI